MLNRKRQLANGSSQHTNGSHSGAEPKGKKHPRRFIISAKARNGRRATEVLDGSAKLHSSPGKPTPARVRAVTPPVVSSIPPDMTETIKALVELAREHGHITFDDINDAQPEGLAPEDLDELYAKLRGLDIEIVEHAQPERAKPEPEEEEDHRFEVLDDPVRMYMNQMGKVPLLTREQEVEICKRIEDADLEMKRLVYSLGFTAKEHCALAEKLLADPPKERFDRIVVDKKVTSRENHLQALRGLLKKVRVLDALVDQHYLSWQKAPSPGRRQKFLAEFQKLDRKLQA